MAVIKTWRSHKTGVGSKYRITWYVSDSPSFQTVWGLNKFLDFWRGAFEHSQRFRVLEQDHEKTGGAFSLGSEVTRIYWVIESLEGGPLGEFFSDLYRFNSGTLEGATFQIGQVETIEGGAENAKPDTGAIGTGGVVETVKETVGYLAWIVPLLLVAVIAWSISKIVS